MNKNMLRHRAFLLLLLAICTQPVQAKQNIEQSCLPFTIVFGNGVANSESDARHSRKILSDIIGTKYKDVDVSYEIAYNPTGGPGIGTLKDVVDAAKQKAAEDNTLWSLTWKVIFGVVSTAEPNQSWVTIVSNIWSEFNAKIVAGTRYNLANRSSYFDSTVAEHVSLYRKLLEDTSNPRRVLLVAHSQGNLYGNVALQRLEDYYQARESDKKYLSRFAMVGVGSAADFVYKDGPYLTSTYDNVINAVRLFYPRVLLGNVTLPAKVEFNTTNVTGQNVTVSDNTGHGFATVYTNPSHPGRALLKSHIEKQLDALHANADDFTTMLRSPYRLYLVKEMIAGDPNVYPHLSYLHTAIDNCWGHPSIACEANYYREVEQAPYTKVLTSHSPNETILWPGEEIPRSQHPGELAVDMGGDQAMEEEVFRRIFDPSNLGYVGFPRSEAQIKIVKRHVSSIAYEICPLYTRKFDYGVICTSLHLEEHGIQAYVNSCKGTPFPKK